MTRLLAAACAALWLAGPAQAHQSAPLADPPPAGAAAAPRPGTHDARSYFTDSPVLDQRGNALRFYSDLLKDRVVLLNVVFTDCEDACPLITAKLLEVRRLLGERFNDPIHFISISTDPLRDDPAALLAFASKQQADQPGWHFLTGRKTDIELILARLGQLAAEREMHSTLLIAGNVGAKRWSKIQPSAPAWAIAERLKLLAEGASERPSGR